MESPQQVQGGAFLSTNIPSHREEASLTLTALDRWARASPEILRPTFETSLFYTSF